MNGEKIARYTSRALREMCARGESRTDWERLRREQKAGIEPDMSDPDDSEISDEEFATVMVKSRTWAKKRGQTYFSYP